jgi:hypothetical protein
MSPTPTPAADVNHDGHVDQLDIDFVIDHLFEPTDTPRNPTADANTDQRVTAADVVAVIEAFP